MEASSLASATVQASSLPWDLGGALVFLGLAALAGRLWRKEDALGSWPRPVVLGTYLVLLVLSFALRIGLCRAVSGVPNDLACFKAWAMALAQGRPSQLYAGSVFVDYPPGYLYVLTAVGRARLLLGLAPDSAGFLLLVKLPAMLLDMGAAALVLWLARPQMSLAGACVLSLLVAWNPAALHNSAAYGQVDVFLAVPLLLALAFVHRGALLRAAVAYAIAVLVKPQALLLVPLAVAVLVRARSLRTAVLATLVFAGVVLALALPFAPGLSPAWLASLYARALSSYPYATLNAANLYALLGANWAPLTLATQLASYGALGLLSLAVAVLYARQGHGDGPRSSDVFAVALSLLTLAFFLGTRMHERYLYPTVLIAAAAYAVGGDRRLFGLFVGYSISVFLNEALLLDLVARTGSFFIPPGDLALRLLSLGNAGLAIVSAAVAVDLGRGRAGRPAPGAASGRRGPARPAPATPTEGVRLSRADYLLMGGLSLAYAAVAFTNLGALRVPQTCWSPLRAGETSYLDLGQARPVDRILYFMGLGKGAYTLSLSTDGRRWSTLGRLEQATRFEKFEWRVLSPEGARGRYLRVAADEPGAALCEVAVFGDPGGAPWPLAAVPAPGSGGLSAKASTVLVDEQRTVAYQPSFLSGMYFDEIYFARTAYELLHHLEPSETTHPPLGKAIIALGIAVFGMTPFGWRVMGTLCGVAMVPLLYLLARRLFRRSDLAALAGFLLACDFMHFVQTRIATVDAYAVLFVLLMYLFFHDYLAQSFWHTPRRRLLMPLLGSGIAFGLGVACKWSVLYGGAGLAVLLFASLGARAHELRQAGAACGPGERAETSGGEAMALFVGRASAVLGWSCLSFVLVPALIYLLAYLPFMRLPGPGHALRDVVAAQASMFRYHSQLAQTHPFASAWWQWPVMHRPVWYYQGTHGLPFGTVSSIVALGNPAIWWPGIAAVGALLVLALRSRDPRSGFILVALLSEFLPWAIAPRKLTFIYHFFPSVPFLVLAIVYVGGALTERSRAYWPWVIAYGVAVGGLFVLFYPVLSAMPVSKDFVLHWLRWLDSWIFC